MGTEKLKERSKSLAQRTLAAVEEVERRIVGGESGAVIRSAVEQLRGAIESLGDLKAAGTLDDQTGRLTSYLDARVRAMEQLIEWDAVGGR